MAKLVFSCAVLFTLLSIASRVTAQSTFPVGAVFGIVFGVFGVGLGICLPLGIWCCVFCGAAHASNRQNQRPVNSFVVTPGSAPRPQPGSYPTQPQAQPSASAYPSAYPAQPYQTPPPSYPANPAPPPTNPAYPPQQTSPYPTAPTYTTSLYPDAPPPYVPPVDN